MLWTIEELALLPDVFGTVDLVNARVMANVFGTLNLVNARVMAMLMAAFVLVYLHFYSNRNS